ncbi:twin-arginine translocase subunit TatC, partial [Chloroflexota bacterium]
VAPALTRREKNVVYLVIPWITLMFVGGVLFGYFMLAPWSLWFLADFGRNYAAWQPSITSYLGFLTKLMLTVGIVFEFPVVSTFLARIGLLKPQWLASKRKVAIIIAFIAAAVITPPDPITQSLLAIPLILLYEMSYWLARLVYKRKQEAIPIETDSEDEE